MNAYEFQAQRNDGFPMSGTLHARSAEEAQESLVALGLVVLSLKPVAMPVRAPYLSNDDLTLLNEQLIQLTTAGLPMERGLALLADDLERSPAKHAMQSLADDLSRGASLESAIDARRSQFPPIYARLIDAGVRAGNLPGMLHAFGRHLEVIGRLKNELWRACAYPLVVLTAFALLLTLLSYALLPQYLRLLNGMGVSRYNWRTGEHIRTVAQTPWLVETIYLVGFAMPYFLGALLLALAGTWITWRVLKSRGREGRWVDAVVLRIPLFGRALRHSLIARWVDSLAIGVRSGMDLPGAIQLAGQVIALPSLDEDGRVLGELLASGKSLDSAPPLQCLPASIPPTLELASRMGRLPETLDSLARDYTRQTEQRIRMIPATVLPILVVLIGLFAGGIIYSLWMPLAQLIQGMSGGGKW